MFMSFMSKYLREQLLPDDADDHEGTLVELHHLELAVRGLEGGCVKEKGSIVKSNKYGTISYLILIAGMVI